MSPRFKLGKGWQTAPIDDPCIYINHVSLNGNILWRCQGSQKRWPAAEEIWDMATDVDPHKWRAWAVRVYNSNALVRWLDNRPGWRGVIEARRSERFPGQLLMMGIDLERTAAMIALYTMLLVRPLSGYLHAMLNVRETLQPLDTLVVC